MNDAHKIKSIILFNHVMSAIGLIYADLSWLLVSLVGFILIYQLGAEVGLHRYLAHRAFETSYWKSRTLICLGMFSCLGSPMAWAGIHRKHHAFSDEKGDPHGCQPWYKVWSTFWEPYTVESKYVKNLLRDNWIRFTHKNYFKILISTYLVLTLIDWRLSTFLISIPAVLAFNGAGMVNTICHRYGYRRYDTRDNSTNNIWVNNLFTMGSALHNTHHQKPTAWKHSEKWWEIDLPAFFIKWFLIKEERNEGRT